MIPARYNRSITACPDYTVRAVSGGDALHLKKAVKKQYIVCHSPLILSCMCDRTEIQNIVRDSKYVDVTNSRLFLKQLVFPFIVVA